MSTSKGNAVLMKNKSNKFPPISLKAIDICRPIIALNSSRTLLDARNSMLRYKISRIVVSLNGKAVGIVTEKDITNSLYDIDPTKRLSEIALKELIQKKLLTVNESSTIDYCCKLMLQKNISSLIVNDDQGKDKGIITKTDIVEVYAYHQPSDIPVYECMSDKVYSVAPDESIHMVALLMDIHKISRVIVQKNMKPVGIVTGRDFLPISLIQGTSSLGRYWMTRNDTTLAKKKQRYIPSGMIGIVLAQDIMTSAPVTIHKNVTIVEAARIMIRNRISGLPVINSKGHLVGIITKTDILKSRFS
jgi:CBS domain-containing protein